MLGALVPSRDCGVVLVSGVGSWHEDPSILLSILLHITGSFLTRQLRCPAVTAQLLFKRKRRDKQLTGSQSIDLGSAEGEAKTQFFFAFPSENLNVLKLSNRSKK